MKGREREAEEDGGITDKKKIRRNKKIREAAVIKERRKKNSRKRKRGRKKIGIKEYKEKVKE